jgi:hypothetical protein
MVPNRELIQKLNNQREELLNQLQIQKADVLSEQILLLKKYYKHLLFAYTSQFIDGDFQVNDFNITVQDGMIASQQLTIDNSQLTAEFEVSGLHERRNNELLAYDKSEFDHRWIVFSFVYNTNPEMIESLFLESIEEIQLKMFEV